MQMIPLDPERIQLVQRKFGEPRTSKRPFCLRHLCQQKLEGLAVPLMDGKCQCGQALVVRLLKESDRLVRAQQLLVFGVQCIAEKKSSEVLLALCSSEGQIHQHIRRKHKRLQKSVNK